ncbi:MAG: flagellar hook-basal body complex protein FliE [Rhodobiaceae bacterium]|nr:flagellar hook-basal body complex protein FliE [Rhodobiaceae bacterium]MCC0016881.1 flagellar hook-basal body complex protein FliE [Rhodobiaceae bacterium]MCC0042116.1 flagellar hook-basal body complex protein FliE [Rhodobiaceae bacterium]
MTPLGAAKAYSAMAQQAMRTGGTSALDATKGASPQSFAQMVVDAANDVTDKAKAADQVTAAAAAGRADLVNVVTAVSETELAMETLVGLRDRVIGAYEQIMRMPI